MNRRSFFVLCAGAAAAPLVLSAGPALACGQEPAFTKPLRFAPGSTATSVKHTIDDEHTHEWVLTGKPGQPVEIAIAAKKSGVTLMPDSAGAPNKPQWAAAPKNGQFVKRWKGVLPKTGRMLIEVTTEAKKEAYTLDVRLG